VFAGSQAEETYVRPSCAFLPDSDRRPNGTDGLSALEFSVLSVGSNARERQTADPDLGMELDVLFAPRIAVGQESLTYMVERHSTESVG